MMVAERAKSIKNGQCTIYVFEKDEPSVELFRALFLDGSSLVDRAIEALETRCVSSASLASATGETAGLHGGQA
jgi:hypothetical protein